MAEPARKLPTTFEEFLVWDDGTDTRFEFIGGRPIAMAPGTDRHGLIAQNAGNAIDHALGDGSSCSAIQGAGIEAFDGADRRFYVADVAMTCEPIDGKVYLNAPRLIVEILSPSTAGYDRKRKVPDYCRLPSVEEVWLIESRGRWVMVWQRVNGDWIGSIPYSGAQSFRSRTPDVEVGLDRLYRNVVVDLPPDQEEAAGQS